MVTLKNAAALEVCLDQTQKLLLVDGGVVAEILSEAAVVKLPSDALTTKGIADQRFANAHRKAGSAIQPC